MQESRAKDFEKTLIANLFFAVSPTISSLFDKKKQATGTHFGRPACMARSASIMAAPGSFSLGFRMKVLPAVTAHTRLEK